MRKLIIAGKKQTSSTILIVLALMGISGLLLYKLAGLTGGLSVGEIGAASAAVGWHGIYHDPFYLPLKLVRSVIFYLFADHGQLLTRLPNTLFGLSAILSFGWLIKTWHSTRIAVLTTFLFATSAWVLHASRLASFDVLYLWAVVLLLAVNVLSRKYGQNIIVWYGSLILWGVVLYIPGMVWFVLLSVYLQRSLLVKAWRHFSSVGIRITYLFTGIIFLPLLVIGLTRHGRLEEWLGLPSSYGGLLTVIKHFLAVPVHLFIRGPQYTDIWLARLPILDIFTLVVCGLGIYFYATHIKAGRSRLLSIFFITGFVLVGLGGPVGLSVLVPLLYIAAATGIAFLLREWLQVFPLNPLARALGIILISSAVLLSCAYNMRAYFIAWPHNKATKAAFQYRR